MRKSDLDTLMLIRLKRRTRRKNDKRFEQKYKTFEFDKYK